MQKKLMHLLNTISSYVYNYPTAPLQKIRVKKIPTFPLLHLSCEELFATLDEPILLTGNTQSKILVLTSITPTQNNKNEIGKLLDKMLAAINLSVTNSCVVCLLQEQKTKQIPETISYLVQQEKPTIMLAMGEYLANVLQSNKVEYVRGNFKLYKKTPLIHTYSASEAFEKNELKQLIWQDLKFFAQKLP